MTRPPARCGTQSGWSKHKRQGEKPCDACATAKREYDKRWRAGTVAQQKNRLSAKAQMRAYQRLARQFPTLYREYFLVAKAEVFDEAGVEW